MILNTLFYLLVIINFIRVLISSFIELTISGTIFLIGIIFKMDKVKRYGINKAIALDQWGNTELLGDPDETISSRLGRSIGKERYFWIKWFRIFVDMLFLFDTGIDKKGNKIGHCQKSVIPLKSINYEIWNWNKD